MFEEKILRFLLLTLYKIFSEDTEDPFFCLVQTKEILRCKNLGD